MIWLSYTDTLCTKMMGYPWEINWNLHHQHFLFKIKKKTTKMTWHFVISAVWASTVFDPLLWQVCSCWHSLAEVNPPKFTIRFSDKICQNRVWYASQTMWKKRKMSQVLAPNQSCLHVQIAWREKEESEKVHAAFSCQNLFFFHLRVHKLHLLIAKHRSHSKSCFFNTLH